MTRRAAGPLVTKKHLARAERERLQRRWIIAGTIFIGLAVIGLLAYGWVRDTYLLPQEPVAVVNGQPVTTRQFQERVRLLRLDLIGQYANTQQLALWLQGDDSLGSYFQEQLSQIEAQLDDSNTIGLQALRELIEEQLIQQEAQRRGITVSAEEVEAKVAAEFGFFPHGTPTPVPSPTFSPATQTARAAAPSATPVPTATPSASPTPGPSPTPTATLPPTASPTPYTFEAYQANYQAALDSLREYGVREAAFRARYEADLWRAKLLQAFEVDVPRQAEQVWVRHIVVNDRLSAAQVRRMLLAGESWETLAAQYSVDEATKDIGGDLGWAPRGELDPAIETLAFELPVGEISEPLETVAGWEVIQVLGREERPLEEAQYRQAVQAAFDAWLGGQLAQADIEIKPVWLDRIPVEPTLAAAG